MAVMASETPVDPVSVSGKTHPLADLTSDPDVPQVNGGAHHDDEAPQSNVVAQNGTKHTVPDEQPPVISAESALPKSLPSEDGPAAPVDHVTSGITGVAAFLPELSEPVPSAVDPPATSTEPPAVEAPVSNMRDEPMVADDRTKPEKHENAGDVSQGNLADPAHTMAAEHPAPNDPTHAPESTRDKMDVSEEKSPAAVVDDADQGDVMMGGIDETVPAVEPQVSDVVTTIAGESAPTPPAQVSDQLTTGLVRPREEDEEVEPAPKRAKTETSEADNAVVSSDVAVPSTEGSIAPVQTPAAQSLPAPAANSLATPAAPLATVPLDSSPMTKIQQKYLIDQVRKAKKTKSAVAFINPVDVVVLNIPTYLTIIKQPMDLSTMESKLKTMQYATADELMADFTTMVQNSLTFNGKDHPVSISAINLKAYWDKCVEGMPRGQAAQAAVKPSKPSPAPPKASRPARTSTAPIPAPAPAPPVTPVAAPAPAPPPPPPPPPAPPATAKSPVEPAGFLDEHGNPMIRRTSTAQTDRPKREIVAPKARGELPYNSIRPKKKKAQLELKFCESVLTELNKKKYSAFAYAFMAPVDPVALNIPNYHRIVKKPMDFGTITTKLKDGAYASAKEFHSDAKLVFSNCYKFNPPTDEVNKMGHMFEDAFDREWENRDAWIASNQPHSEPPSEDEEEEEEEEVQEDPNIRRMQEIQAQIAALSAEALQLTQTNSRPSPKVASGKKASKPSLGKKAAAPKSSTTSAPKTSKPKAKPKPLKRLTMDQKREVSEGIANLDENKMRKAVEIIRRGVPHLANVQDDELELDIDEIPDEVVFQLWEYVRKNLPKKERDPSPEYEDDELDEEYVAASKPTAHRKKNKPMKAKEQEERIAQLKEKLSGGNGSGSSASPAAAQHDSDDEASEESEEE